ncbi:unnamed protein product [Adineta ricciae]|uniref:Uncharacterized protein n=1 Tax=Adineta ricciae TaxID=249248 RepID=A0A814P2C6_ADIRI|nr:unnamed protein product [Adineta ricciae]CAF1100250.1 unnamed protein product [Adineta ricciae]
MCVMSVTSILLMIAVDELTFSQSEELNTTASRVIKLVISILTGIVLILVLYFINNSIEDWRVRLTHSRAFIITLELTICAVHPMPRLYSTDSGLADVLAYLFAKLLFIRLYFLCQGLMYYSI